MIAIFQNKKAGTIAAIILVAAVIFNTFWAFSNSIGHEITVEVLHDGKRTVLRPAESNTVKAILEEGGIEIGKLDLVDPPLTYVVRYDETITITRRELVKREESQVIPPQTVETYSSLLKEGERRALSEGIPGLRVTRFEQMHEDGKPIEDERKVKTEIVTKPLAGHVLVGNPGVAVSPLRFDGEQLDENGIPESYQSVIRQSRAAGYSARPGAKTASGRDAVVGHVAVNPNVIAYGTRLYITSADGSFIYGYAIAADTGTSLKQGVIGVDLFYSTHEEARMNGIKYVDIYILD